MREQQTAKMCQESDIAFHAIQFVKKMNASSLTIRIRRIERFIEWFTPHEYEVVMYSVHDK
ncbi:hypothetical protein J6590_071578 [Homalodisca vitripennis]|nr:hypothetical protein J6590_071578 [Homalodisca vitripennis]